MAILLQAENINKSFGERVLLESVSFTISQGDKIGLIAKNGSGKTTLLNIIAGKDAPDSGNIIYANGIKIAYLEQDPYFNPELTVIEACFEYGSEKAQIIKEYNEATLSNNYDLLNKLVAKLDSLDAWDYESKIKQILGQLKISNLDQKVSSLSGGQIKRVALANVLITEPDLIILDEPTNHLDLDMVEWLEDYLKRSKLALLMVTHDRYFLDRVCNEIIEIDLRKIYSYKGGYSYFLTKREERLNAQQQEADRATNLLRKETEWMRRQPQARATKSKSRIDAYYELEKKSKLERDKKKLELSVKAQYIGKKIFEAKNVAKAFDDVTILNDFNYTFTRFQKMGIVGSNGAGKSTFIKLLMGEVKPDSGFFDVGETIKFGYYSQTGLTFDDDMKVIDAITNIAEYVELGNDKKMSASQLLQMFLFPPSQQHDFIKKLSGGEKRRLYLCSILMTNPNFLVLDEPTNDFDIHTLNILEEYLVSFKGCVIVVSHDRFFMDKVVDNILVFKGQGEIQNFPGNYSQYREFAELIEKNQKEETKEKKSQETQHKKTDLPKEKEDSRKKLSYKEKREFESLENEIAKLEEEKGEIEKEMSEGNLSTNELIEKSERMGTLITLIDEKTFRWLELSEFA